MTGQELQPTSKWPEKGELTSTEASGSSRVRAKPGLPTPSWCASIYSTSFSSHVYGYSFNLEHQLSQELDCMLSPVPPKPSTGCSKNNTMELPCSETALDYLFLFPEVNRRNSKPHSKELFHCWHHLGSKLRQYWTVLLRVHLVTNWRLFQATQLLSLVWPSSFFFSQDGCTQLKSSHG